MPDIKELIQQYLPSVKIMQLATCVDNQPWACTVHYFSDNNFNIYWCSKLETRHSREVEQNPRISAAIVVHENTPEENYVIGISLEGTAKLLGTDVEEEIGLGYEAKLKTPPGLVAAIMSGKNPHKFYHLEPTKIVLFDKKTFPDNPRQELNLP